MDDICSIGSNRPSPKKGGDSYQKAQRVTLHQEKHTTSALLKMGCNTSSKVMNLNLQLMGKCTHTCACLEPGALHYTHVLVILFSWISMGANMCQLSERFAERQSSSSC